MTERKVPLRTCVGCRGVKEKSELIRIVRTPEGEVKADFSGRAAGRGAYLCPQRGCLELALKKGGFARSLHVTLTEEQTENLRRELKEFEERDP
nr:YlxR family protein [Lachnospiraceae bacterium]